MSNSKLIGKAVYDFSKSPITADFSVFLAVARLELALKTGSPEFTLSFRAQSWRNETRRELRYTIDDRLWRLHNLIIPICGMTPGVLAYDLSMINLAEPAGDDPQMTVQCENGNYLIPSLVDVFNRAGFDPHLYAAPELALRYANRILGGVKDAVVVSIRGSSFSENRNTNSGFAADLLQNLVATGKKIFLIPDQELDPEVAAIPDGVKLVYEASFNLPLRLALHELAGVSVCAGGGLTILLSLAIRKPNFVVYHPMHLGDPVSDPKWMAKMAWQIGVDQPLPWIPNNQIWLWDPEIAGSKVCDAALSLI